MDRNLVLVILVSVMLSACNSPAVRTDYAEKLALTGGFKREIFNTLNFKVLSFYRIAGIDETVTVYIEGDGYAYTARREASRNPTPVNPLALKLALLDESANVIYIARPCQFVPLADNPDCQVEYWTNRRYSKDIISAVSDVINGYKQKFPLQQIRLVGYSGGGTIAAILSALRTDILDLRTIAGNLDINMFTRINNVLPLNGSLNPTDFAETLVHIPQLHLIGQDDKVVPQVIVDSYLSVLKPYDTGEGCITSKHINNVSHTKGWDAAWKVYMNREIRCGMDP